MDKLAALPPLRVVPAPPGDRAAVQPSPATAIAPVNGQYTAASREAARELWGWVYGRSFTTTAERTGVSLRTLHAWAKTERWRERYEEERADLAPADVRFFVALGLGNDAMAARDYLGAVARGELPGDKLRLLASTSVLDRAGFAPIHFSQADLNQERQRRTRQASAGLDPAAVAALPTEERRALLRRYEEGER